MYVSEHSDSDNISAEAGGQSGNTRERTFWKCESLNLTVVGLHVTWRPWTTTMAH
jgi:hypothetical protein